MEPNQPIECPICKNVAHFLYNSDDDCFQISCSRCGKYEIEGRTEAHFKNEDSYSPIIRNNISCWIFEHQSIRIGPNDINFFVNLKTPTLEDKSNKLLMFLAKENPIAGRSFSLEGEDFKTLLYRRKNNRGVYEQLIAQLNSKKQSSKYLAASWAFDYDEFCFIINDYLYEQFIYIDLGDYLNRWMITPLGWAHIEELNSVSPQSDIAFIAMWFDSQTNKAYQNAIEPAITSAGYEPLRIDRHQHNNKIDDEIIAGIRRSKFVVCDFTGQRGGVYFESGYALGLGLQVIWTCRKDEVEQIHFDNRQYNFLLWEEDKLAEFKKALQNRIEATIGRPS